MDVLVSTWKLMFGCYLIGFIREVGTWRRSVHGRNRWAAISPPSMWCKIHTAWWSTRELRDYSCDATCYSSVEARMEIKPSTLFAVVEHWRSSRDRLAFERQLLRSFNNVKLLNQLAWEFTHFPICGYHAAITRIACKQLFGLPNQPSTLQCYDQVSTLCSKLKRYHEIAASITG